MSVRISTPSDASPGSPGAGKAARIPVSGNCRVPGPGSPLAARLWDLLQPVARLWGIVTAVVMSGAGAELAVIGYYFAPGMLVGAAMVLLLETMWVVALFVDLLARRGDYTFGLRCWDFMRWSCGRARAPVYACAATALLLTHLTPLCIVSGSMLLGLALLRAAVPFSPHATHGPHSPRAGSSLLSQVDTPEVFFNAASNNTCDNENNKSEEMTVLEVVQHRSRSVTPVPPVLLDL